MSQKQRETSYLLLIMKLIRLHLLNFRINPEEHEADLQSEHWSAFIYITETLQIFASNRHVQMYFMSIT